MSAQYQQSMVASHEGNIAPQSGQVAVFYRLFDYTDIHDAATFDESCVKEDLCGGEYYFPEITSA